jgi:glycosyltransferase involved in cell wall biosynthesis
MPAPYKISIITPSLNKGAYIRQAIASVATQDYSPVEHIVVDGGSQDDTIAILHTFPHLKWVSESDGGQASAMNKGLALATGDIIGYLNADDYYLPGAFARVAEACAQGAVGVVGQIQILLANGLFRINDGRVEHLEMLKHWQPDAYCVNSVGYFFRRELITRVGGFDERNVYNMDLEFLLAASAIAPLTKISHVLGAFRYTGPGITANAMLKTGFWNPTSFPFIERFLQGLDGDFVRRYQRQRRRGYWLKRMWLRISLLLDVLPGPQNSWRRRQITRARIRLRPVWLRLQRLSRKPALTREHPHAANQT